MTTTQRPPMTLLRHQLGLGLAENCTPKRAKKTKADGSKIRKIISRELHAAMDEQVDKRRWRLEDAVNHKDTHRECEIITAAIGEASIKYHKPKENDATKMRGRSKAMF